ncbi:MAG TPA: hypothetical protein VNB94_12910 [Mycobacteriales bacterium]|nr:hypothetical protein [Mycobacteriales bacterium]
MSPVLLIVLAGLWAAVLIPATMRSRDHAHDGRTMDGFSTAMRTLSRRPAATADSRRILVPTTSVTGPQSPGPSLARRRTVFLRLLGLTVVSFVLAMLFGGPLWWLVQLAANAGLLAVVVWLRRTALAEAEQARQVRLAVRADRMRREAAQLAAYRSRADRSAYLDLTHRRAVGD